MRGGTKLWTSVLAGLVTSLVLLALHYGWREARRLPLWVTIPLVVAAALLTAILVHEFAWPNPRIHLVVGNGPPFDGTVPTAATLLQSLSTPNPWLFAKRLRVENSGRGTARGCRVTVVEPAFGPPFHLPWNDPNGASAMDVNGHQATHYVYLPTGRLPSGQSRVVLEVSYEELSRPRLWTFSVGKDGGYPTMAHEAAPTKSPRLLPRRVRP